MCDYSLAGFKTRLAVEGEELVVYRFPTGSIGLTSPDDLANCRREVCGWWSRLAMRDFPCAVCVPPGTRLLLCDIPKRLQMRLGLGAVEEVTFVQKDFLLRGHRDAVRFRNNQEILLQHLVEDQRVRVILLPDSSLEETDEVLELSMT
jgi:hypothetical protein